jgi:hypothetical protein
MSAWRGVQYSVISFIGGVVGLISLLTRGVPDDDRAVVLVVSPILLAGGMIGLLTQWPRAGE